MIEVDTGVWYDPAKTWYNQSQDCQALGEALIQDTPTSTVMEDCLDGQQRMLSGVWETTPATGTFEMSVTRHYQWPPMSRGWRSLIKQDTVTVTPI